MEYRNNKLSLFVVLLLPLLVVSVSCNDFLDKSPYDQLPANGYWNSPERAAEAINSAYAGLQLDGLWKNEIYKIHDFPSDDGRGQNTWGSEMNTFAHSPTDQTINDVYNDAYKVIQRANLVLNKVPDIDMEDNLKNRYLAEAEFLRALIYSQLTSIYGQVPLLTEYSESPEDALVAKSSISEIYAQIIPDLQDAARVLPASYSGSDVGRATKGAAQSLLGKVYLYDQNYEQAAKWFGKVIDSNTYKLDDNFENIINRNHENDSEAVFEVQFQQGGYDDVTNHRVDYNLPQGGGGSGNILPFQNLIDAFEKGDPRLDYTVFRDGQPFAPNLDDPRLEMYNPAWSATGYNLKKGLVPVKITQNGGTNWPVIRYADVLLMYAEAVNAKSNREPTEAIWAINQVRSRKSVDMPTYPNDKSPYSVDTNSSQQDIFKAIIHERRVELAFEGKRYADLRRWGLAEKVLGERGYSEPKYRYMPLPQDEVDINLKLEQREDW